MHLKQLRRCHVILTGHPRHDALRHTLLRKLVLCLNLQTRSLALVGISVLPRLLPLVPFASNPFGCWVDNKPGQAVKESAAAAQQAAADAMAACKVEVEQVSETANFQALV